MLFIWPSSLGTDDRINRRFLILLLDNYTCLFSSLCLLSDDFLINRRRPPEPNCRDLINTKLAAIIIR